MTVSVFVQVPDHAAFTAEVTTIDRLTDGRVRGPWREVLKPGQAASFYPHNGGSIFVAEGRVDAEFADGRMLAAVFAFSLGEQIGLIDSDERGTVIARAEYDESARQYLIRYRAGDGRLTESWWSETAIAAVPPPALPAPAEEASPVAPDPGPAPAQAVPEASPSAA